MKTIPLNVVVSDEEYELILSGVLNVCGLLKDKRNIIRKHLPAIISTATKVSKLSAHDVVTLAQLGVSAVTVIGAGVKCAREFYAEYKQHREMDEERDNELPDNIIYFEDILKAQNEKKKIYAVNS